MSQWTFLTHHAHVLLEVAKNADATLEEIADAGSPGPGSLHGALQLRAREWPAVQQLPDPPQRFGRAGIVACVGAARTARDQQVPIGRVDDLANDAFAERRELLEPGRRHGRTAGTHRHQVLLAQDRIEGATHRDLRAEDVLDDVAILVLSQQPQLRPVAAHLRLLWYAGRDGQGCHGNEDETTGERGHGQRPAVINCFASRSSSDGAAEGSAMNAAAASKSNADDSAVQSPVFGSGYPSAS